MKMQHSFPRWALAGTLILVVVLALVAWKGNPQQHRIAGNQSQDTIPDKKRNKVSREAGDRDLDKELRQLEKASEEMKAKEWEKDALIKDIDVEKIQKQAAEAVQRAELDKVHKHIEESLSRIDFDKLQQQIDESMADVDKAEIKEALQKAKRQVKVALEKVQLQNKEEMEKQMMNLKKQMEELRVNMKQEKFNLKKEMERANQELRNAKEEFKGYQEMIYDMEKEGLLNTNEDYSIEYKDGELYVNDKKQSDEITSRYKKYLKKDKITIKKENGDMHIHQNPDKHLD